MIRVKENLNMKKMTKYQIVLILKEAETSVPVKKL